MLHKSPNVSCVGTGVRGRTWRNCRPESAHFYPQRQGAHLMIRRTLVLAAVLCLTAAATAAADAPDPIPSATQGTVVQNSDGTFTLTVHGQWQWTTHHSDCNKDRAGVGYAVAWNDS